jgi:MFS transporter, DHA2 family, multidrug resistance protein
MGTLGDRIGRRKLLLMGACAFGIASVFAAYANSAVMLIAARAVLGIAGATLAPSTLSLIRNMFHDPKQRTIAIGVWITSYSAGGAIGPLIGGVVLQHFWWGAVFLIAVPVMVLLLVLGPILLPEYRNPGAGSLDLFSALLSLIAVLSAIFGLKKIAENGVDWIAVLSITAGLVVGILFIKRQNKLSDPLIDLKLFRLPSFGASLLIYTLGTFVVFASFVFIFQYMQLVGGLTPIKAGLWSLPFFCAFIIGSILTPMIVRRVYPGKLMAAGSFMAVIGFILLSRVSTSSDLVLLVTASFIYSLGLAPVFTLTTDLIVGTAPPERAGAASAISETGSELGGALGIAIIGSIGAFIYRQKMAPAVLVDIPDDVANAARETLGGAAAEASRLPAELGIPLLNSANKAFIAGMQVIALICGIVAAGVAILSLTRLKHASPGSSIAKQG